MRPFFFRKPKITEDRRPTRFTPSRGAGSHRIPAKKNRGVVRAVLGFLTPSAKADTDRAAMAAARAKRERRMARNRAWWANDRTWEFYGRAR